SRNGREPRSETAARVSAPCSATAATHVSRGSEGSGQQSESVLHSVGYREQHWRRDRAALAKATGLLRPCRSTVRPPACGTRRCRSTWQSSATRYRCNTRGSITHVSRGRVHKL